MLDVSQPPCFCCNQSDHAMKDCPVYLGYRNRASKERGEWYANHKLCPKCKSDKNYQTLARAPHIFGAPFEDDVNDATCTSCGWKGKVKELIK